jgi:hypothetical protein
MTYRGGANNRPGPFLRGRGIFGGGSQKGSTDPTIEDYVASKIGIAIPDGTSNTILLSERLIGIANDTNPKIGGGVEAGVFDSNGNDAKVKNPRLCLNLPDGRSIPSNKTMKPAPDRTNERGFSYPGTLSGFGWGDGITWSSGFHTILPPNAPSCAPSQTDSISNTRVLVAATSNHTGGVNVCVVDGSGRFVSDTVDTGDLTIAPGDDASRASLYGVWGAFGTTDGGECNSLP